MGEIMELRISSSTPTNSLGSAIDRYINEGKFVKLFAIGVRSMNQACKGIAVAGKYAYRQGKRLTAEHVFETIIDKDSKEKVIRMRFDLYVTNLKEGKEIEEDVYIEE